MNVNVELAERSYEIRIGYGISKEPAVAAPVIENRKCLLVSDSNVFPLYGERVLEILRKNGASNVESVVFTAGEESKNLETILTICRKAAQANLDRKSILVALGGGVTGDMAGFSAAIYMRGIRFIQIPTTLLAMVDSSVGGKTGVDIPEGKNLIGAFHQPDGVFIDTEFLNTLPSRQYLCGMAEIIKTAAILDPVFFDLLETNVELIRARDKDFTAEMIARCCALKADVVAQDEKESGLRAILNFGHTFGHAFECRADYTLPHGEAVAVGMVLAARLSAARGLLSGGDAERLTRLIRGVGLPVVPPAGHSSAEIIETMFKDKKTMNGILRFVLLNAIGKASVCPVAPEEAEAVLKGIRA